MDKNAIKKYAVWARNELIARVTQKAEQYEITEKKITPKDADSIGGRLLTEAEKNQRKALIEKIQADGFEQVMEEVAYTWFNRFTALRFMEVNNYLPSHTRVFTNESGEFKPQILADAIQLDLEGLNMDKVFELKDANRTEELYKYLLITQCNALSVILPRMFQKIEHYTELLLPDYLLREGSVIEQMIALIPEEDWTDQVQIIGWLYQFYNIEPKDKAFADLKKKIKISKKTVGAATQLFTPDWIVRYMVENSLGRLWLEGHPNDALKSEWKYYLDEAEQEADVQKQLDEIRKEYATLKPEEIRCIDPCMGSGHILCYMFDVLVKIYEDYGYTAREAVESIVEKNLWGLDIDERAAQLSYFAVMMKARQYDRRFFSKKDENGELCIPQPHVYAIEESNGITSAPMHDMGIGLSQEEYGKAVKEAMRLVEEMNDAKEYGSIIHVTSCDWDLLRRFAVPRWISEGQMRMDIHGEIEASERLQDLINIGEALSQKYHAVVTNPPYMATSNGSNKLVQYVKDYYENSKADMFAVFIEKCMSLTKQKAFSAMITQHSWMFISTYEKLRAIVLYHDMINMAHLGARAFEEIAGEVVQTVSFIRRNTHISNYRGTYSRLVNGQSQNEKESMFLSGNNQFITASELYSEIPGSPVAYWVGKGISNAFRNGKPLGKIAVARNGMKTGDNSRFLRFWWEISFKKLCCDAHNVNEAIVSKAKWFPYNKGGEARKWYGNNEYVVNWEYSGREIFEHAKADGRNVQDYPEEMKFSPSGTWSLINTGVPTFRYKECNLSDIAGMSFYQGGDKTKYLLGFCNTPIASEILQLLAPTINYQAGDIARLPILFSKEDEITEKVNACIDEAKNEWDSYETSWDFKSHSLVPMAYERREQLEAGLNSEERRKSVSLISDRYARWSEECNYRFSNLKANEEDLNRKFIEIYHLQDEVEASVKNEDVTLRCADLSRDIRSLISYAVGCMFGRYSLDIPGLVYAGGVWDDTKYISFSPDRDAIIPICDDEYFEDDIVGRFIKFIETAFGKATLEVNLKFIADALGGKGTSREVIRNYFINEFYADHLKIYQKRPIYWLFDSGKKNGFKCLVYIHRYQSDTIARIRTDYVHEQQSRYRTAIADLEQRANSGSSSDRVKLNKQLSTLQDQATEIREYEEKIHHLADQMISIDLDDGVKKNYEIFQDVLAKLK